MDFAQQISSKMEKLAQLTIFSLEAELFFTDSVQEFFFFY